MLPLHSILEPLDPPGAATSATFPSIVIGGHQSVTPVAFQIE